MDATSTVLNPELISLRGLSPLVLVPIANPSSALSLVSLASSLMPSSIGRVLMLSVIESKGLQAGTSSADTSQADAAQQAKLDASQMLIEHLRAAELSGIPASSMTTVAPSAMEEIVRVARLHRCQSLMVGFGSIAESARGSKLEWLLGALDAEIVVLRAPTGWQPTQVRRVLVPVAGLGGHDALLARLLSSLTQRNAREITFFRVLPESATEKERRQRQRDLRHRADDEAGRSARVELVTSADPISAVAARAEQSDLIIVGIQRLGRQHKLFGSFTRQLAARTQCPLIAISRRG